MKEQFQVKSNGKLKAGVIVDVKHDLPIIGQIFVADSIRIFLKKLDIL